LRIQACTLARTHPGVALELLERYFALPDDFDHAQAFVDRATALLALGRLEDAVDTYEMALAREVGFPNVRTQAYLDLPFLIAITPLPERYGRAMELLRQHEDRLTFPVDHFRRNASRALMLADGGDQPGAQVHARRALEAAQEEASGFRYHPAVGLVEGEHEDLIANLEAFVDA
jgi:tetratricopeptide (TPR) repeat protein